MLRTALLGLKANNVDIVQEAGAMIDAVDDSLDVVDAGLEAAARDVAAKRVAPLLEQQDVGLLMMPATETVH